MTINGNVKYQWPMAIEIQRYSYQCESQSMANHLGGGAKMAAKRLIVAFGG